MHTPSLLFLLLTSLSLSLTPASASAHALHPRAAHANHNPPQHHLHARSARPRKVLHKRLWYAPTCNAPEPSPPESPRGSQEDEDEAYEQGGPPPGGSPSTPSGIPIPGLPRTPSAPRMGSAGSVPGPGSLGRIGSGAVPRPGLARTGSSGLFLQGAQLKAHCVESCTCKKLGQLPAHLINHGLRHCGSRCRGICHCGENR